MYRSSSALFLRRVRPDRAALRRGAYGMGSPDIVPVGTTPEPNAGAMLLSAFDIDPSERWVLNASNQIYVRGVNVSNEDSGFEISLYYAPGLATPWPDLLLRNVVPTAHGVAHASMPPTRSGARFVSSDAFCLNTPTQAVSLMASVVSHASPPPPPQARLATARDLVSYYADRPNVAVRSAVVVPVTPAERWAYGFAFESREIDAPGKVVMSNWMVPLGWRLTLAYLPSGSSQPELLITATESEAPAQTFGADTAIHPGMSGSFILAVEPCGVPPTAGWRVEVSLLAEVETDSELFEHGAPHEDIGIPLGKAGASPSATRAIVIGQFVLMARESPPI